MTNVQISLTNNLDLWALLANTLVLLLVGLSFGLFFAGIPQVRFSILELMVVVFLVAIMISPWSSDFLWSMTDATKPRQISQSPAWANYLVCFAIGAVVATVLRRVSQRSSSLTAG